MDNVLSVALAKKENEVLALIETQKSETAELVRKQQKEIQDSLANLEANRQKLAAEIQQINKTTTPVTESYIPTAEDSLIVAEIKGLETKKSQTKLLTEKLIAENEKLLAQAIEKEKSQLVASIPTKKEAKSTETTKKTKQPIAASKKPKTDIKPEEFIGIKADYTLAYQLEEYYIMSYHYEALEAVVKTMKSNAPVKVLIEGHTDNSGPDVYNKYIASKRANTVKRKLVKMGCDETRIITESKGEANPRYSNDTREGRALNRRVEIYLK